MDEEKAMEIEALMAIYMDDFKMLGEDKFEIILLPTDNEDNKVALSLEVKLPPTYPNDVPTLFLKSERGVPTHKLFDLEKSIKEQAKENIGTAMVFTLAQSVKEWLDNFVTASQEPVVVVETEEERRKREEDAHQQRIAGIPITAESFKAWKAKFDAEVKETKKSGVDLEKLKKPTGRQLFEIDVSLILSDTNIADDGESVDASALAKENVVVNWELFDDVPDDDE